MKIIAPTSENQNLISAYLESMDPAAVCDEIIRDCSQVHLMKREDLAMLEFKMHGILDRLTFKNKIDCMQNLSALLKKHDYTFYEEPSIPVVIIDTKEEKIQVPFSFIAHSQTLTEQVNDNSEIPPCISLPQGFTKENLERYVYYLNRYVFPSPDLTTWLCMTIAAERFTCDDEILNGLEYQRPLHEYSLAELETVLTFSSHLHPTLSGSIASEYLNSYINASLESDTSFAQVCNELRNSLLVMQHINTIPITICLLSELSHHNLVLLSSVITNVVSLDVNINEDGVLPAIWTNSLLELTITSVKTIQIPRNLLEHLDTLKLATRLADYSLLNNLPHLEHLSLQDIDDITAVPSGCGGLTLFSAISCEALEDISELDNLPALESCNFVMVPITAVPSGCLKLNNFSASYCNKLKDFSGLNNLSSLEMYHFEKVQITAVPSGCSKLKSFRAINCSRLQNFSALNGLLSLEYCAFNDVPVTAVPSDCPNLQDFSAINCPKLQNFSALNRLLSLQQCFFRDVPITAAPSGCFNLKKFSAINCSHLTNLSGLNGCPSLQHYDLAQTPMDYWQPNR